MIKKIWRILYLTKKRRGIQNMIWDLEFNIFQKSLLREEIRQQRDQIKETISQFKNSNKPKKEIEKKEKALEILEGQIDLLDEEISGDNPSMEPSLEARKKLAYEMLKMLSQYGKK